jgi:hypothetical protein
MYSQISFLSIPGTINLRSSAFICGSFFAEASDINYSAFIKIWISQNSSPQSHHIMRGEMHTKIQEVKYGILFNSKKE